MKDERLLLLCAQNLIAATTESLPLPAQAIKRIIVFLKLDIPGGLDLLCDEQSSGTRGLLA